MPPGFGWPPLFSSSVEGEISSSAHDVAVNATAANAKMKYNNFFIVLWG